MANDFIRINQADSAAKFATDLKNAATKTRELLDLYDAIISRGYHLFESGPPVDFAGFEVAHGIPTGTGQTVWDMVNGALGAMTGTMQNEQAVNLKNRVG